MTNRHNEPTIRDNEWFVDHGGRIAMKKYSQPLDGLTADELRTLQSNLNEAIEWAEGDDSDG